MAGAANDPPNAERPSGRIFAPGAPLRRPGAMAAFLLVAAAGLAADLWTKHAVFQSLLADPALAPRVGLMVAEHGSQPPAEHVLRVLRLRREVFPGFLLTLSTNPGVVFGLPMPPWAVAIATVFTIGLVGYFFASSPAAARWVRAALAIILAGALGNFYDRMLSATVVPGIDKPITGQVRDFLDFSEIRVFGLNYPYIFNVADVLLVIGVAMLILHWTLAGRREKRAERAGRKTA